MAMHLPPDKFIFPLNKMVEPILQHSDSNQRAAAFMAMAVVSEGCADYIMNKWVSGLAWLLRNANAYLFHAHIIDHLLFYVFTLCIYMYSHKIDDIIMKVIQACFDATLIHQFYAVKSLILD